MGLTSSCMPCYKVFGSSIYRCIRCSRRTFQPSSSSQQRLWRVSSYKHNSLLLLDAIEIPWWPMTQTLAPYKYMCDALHHIHTLCVHATRCIAHNIMWYCAILTQLYPFTIECKYILSVQVSKTSDRSLDPHRFEVLMRILYPDPVDYITSIGAMDLLWSRYGTTPGHRVSPPSTSLFITIKTAWGVKN